MQLFIPVILAGGKGERFWPLSRSYRPKQFLSLDNSGKSLIQSTADRVLPLTNGWEHIFVITSSIYGNDVRSHLPFLWQENLLLEPVGKDTAPAVAWSALEISKRFGPDTLIGFFPSDHWIGDVDIFHHNMRSALRLAEGGDAIITLGVTPNYPSTGYGYIELGDPVGKFGGLLAHRLSRFTEKPDHNTANWFISTGRYKWNSGIFIFQAGAVIELLRAHAPEVIEPLEEFGLEAYHSLPKISIDYALMEKIDRAYILQTSFPWDDLGDWNGMDRLLRTPDQANVELANHLGMYTDRTLFYSNNSDDVIVTIGLHDLVVVRDQNVTLIVHKACTQDIKQVLQRLQDDPDLNYLL
ncbi:MAG TPA: mannose-1-phosphate guanylyltransferase [Allocoleopsis sp.]